MSRGLHHPAKVPRRPLAGMVLAFLAVVPTRALPEERPAPTVAVTVEEGLQQVVDDALAANLELQAGYARAAQRLAALDQARARYLPVLDVAGRYSAADGGRTIELPVGDLLNPVYQTLDQMLAATGQPPQFPRVKNQEIKLLRSHEQETKVEIAQPLYEPRLRPTVEASRQQLQSAEASLAALRARVVRDAQQAYYQWLAAQQTVLVLETTRDLARANLDANESLYRNGRITRDLVYRAEADVLEVEQQRLAAASRVHIAQSYVNLLRNAPLAAALPQARIDAATVERFRERLIARIAGRKPDVTALQQLGTSRRQELRGLEAAIAAGEAQQDLARAAFKPVLAVGAEAGIQGETYGVGADERYVLASVILRWNAFRGGADLAALSEAKALTDELRATRDLAAQQVRLEVQQAYENLTVAEASLDTAAKRAEAAAGAFHIATRKRDLGQINQAEFIDARRAYTDAELNLNVVRTAFLGRLAELEYAIGEPRRISQESLR